MRHLLPRLCGSVHSLVLIAGVAVASTALAEGSRQWNADAGTRMHLEYNNAGLQTSGVAIPRRTPVWVYVRAGERLYLGSSANGVAGTGAGAGTGAIIVTRRDGSSFTCPTTNPTGTNNSVGVIHNRAQENNGPRAVAFTGAGADTGSNTQYNPCITPAATAGQDGVWAVEFVSPAPGGGGNPTVVAANGEWNGANDDAPQDLATFTVAAWDVSVRNAGNTGFVDGRVYFNYIAINVGGNTPASGGVNSDLLVLTRDGYRYRADFQGFDPFGAIVYVNNRGFTTGANGTGTPTYGSIALPTTNFYLPTQADNALNTTHKIFLNPPDALLPSSASAATLTYANANAGWLQPTSAIAPVVDRITLRGIEGSPEAGGTVPVGRAPLGATVAFRTNITGALQIGLDINNDGDTTDPVDRLLNATSPGPATPTGFVTVETPWDGRDGQGNAVGAGPLNITVRSSTGLGEFHFPILDAENNSGGFRFDRVSANWTTVENDRMFWNDGAFSGGTSSPNSGDGTPGPAHSWSGGFGNDRGLDTWTFVRASGTQAFSLTVREADLQVTAHALDAPPTPVALGAVVSYSLTVTNAGPQAALGALVRVNVPSEITALGTPTCVAAGGAVCQTQAFNGNTLEATVDLPVGATATYTYSGTLSARPVSGRLTSVAAIQRTADFTDPTATNPDAAPPVPTVQGVRDECNATAAGSGNGDAPTCNNLRVAQSTVLDVDVSPSLVDMPTTFTQGTPYSGSFTCTNAGPNDAINVGCSISGLPPGLSATCSPAVPAATLAANASITCTVSGTPTASGDFPVTATATADNDGNAANNVASTSLTGGSGAGASFGCPANGDAYQVRAGGSASLLLRFPASAFAASGSSSATVVNGSLTPNLNAMGLRETDGFLYALLSAGGLPQLYRVGQAGSALVGTIVTTGAQSPALDSNFLPTGGVFDTAGRYFFIGQGSGNTVPSALYRVDDFSTDVDPGLAGVQLGVAQVYPFVAGSGTSLPVPNVGDIAFGPDGNLYGATQGVVVQLRFSGSSVVVTSRALQSNVGGVGSAFFNDGGSFFVYANGTEQVSEVLFDFGTAFDTQPTPVPVVTRGTVTASGAGSFTAASDGAACAQFSPSDAVAAITLPAVLAPGVPTNGTITCTNNGPSAAQAMTCSASTTTPGVTLSVGTCTPPSPATVRALAGENTITCAITVTAAGPNGGGDAQPTIVATTGETSAVGESNTTNNTATANSIVLDALDDTAPSAVPSTTGGVAIADVRANDGRGSALPTSADSTLLQVSTSNPNVTLDVATGAVNVAPNTPPGTYTLVYRLCDAVLTTVCDTATATVTVGAVIDAVDDAPTALTVAAGGTTPSVISNDLANGQPVVLSGPGANATLQPGAAPTTTAGSIAMAADGTIVVAPGTTPGTYAYPYTICLPAPNASVCDVATAIVVVGSAIDAVDDAPATIPAAGGSTPTVVANDTVDGQPIVLSGPGTNASLAPGTAPSPTAGSITMNPDGTITVAPGTTPGSYSYPYTVCIEPASSPAVCDTATATVVVSGSIDAVDDGPTAIPVGGGATPSVITNDTVNGQPVVLTGPGTNATLAPGTAPTPSAGSIVMNADGTITVAPGTTPGTYTYPYTVCVSPATTPATCDTAIATVVVVAIDAVDDAPTAVGPAGGETASVVLNDSANGQTVVLSGAGTNATLTPGAAPSPTTGSISMNPDGTISIAPGTTPGTYQYPYTICLAAPNAAVCDTALASVVVSGTAPVIVATADGPDAVSPAGGTTPSVIGNDLANGQPVVLTGPGTNATLAPGTAPTPTAGSITMNPDGTITAAPGTTPGTYTYPYTICVVPATTPATCSSTTATVVVSAPNIVAINDGPTPVAATGGTVPSVIGNDRVDGQPVVLSGPGTNATLAPGTAPTPTAGSITMNPDGTITIAPGTTPGTYTYPYTICAVPATTPATCSTATATIVVSSGPIIDAVNDGPTTIPGTGGNTPTVVANDLANGSPLVLSGPGANATLAPGTAPSPAAGSITMNPDGTIAVAPGTTPGTYAYPYTVCLLAPNTGICDSAVATVVVGAVPVVDAVNDGPTTIPASGGNTPSVVTNDTSSGQPIVLAGPGTNATLAPGTAPSPTAGSITMNPDGTITVAPGTTPGTYSYPYTICLMPATTPATCDTATATVVVEPPINVIDAVDDGPTRVAATAGGSTPTVVGNDTVNGQPVVLSGAGTNATLQPGTAPSPAAGSITMNADGTITVAPGTTSGTYTFPYTVCVSPATTPATCDTATATVVVVAIDAVDDAPTAIGAAGGDTASVVLNDSANGQTVVLSGAGTNATLTPGTAPSPTAGAITMNADGTITVAPNTTPGTYQYPYTICLTAPDAAVCDTALASVVVSGSTPAIVATPDGPDSVPPSGGTTPSVLGNDRVNGQPVVLSGPGTNATLQPGTAPSPASGSITMNADGTITVAPGTTPGTYSYPYTICVVPATTPATCSTSTATVVVSAPTIVAANDGPTPISATGGSTPSVVGNDTVNGQPVVLGGPGTNATLTPGTAPSPTAGAITMNPDGTITVAPGTTPGTYTYPYTICVVPATTPPTCSTATATVVVSAGPVVDAVNDGPTTIAGSGGTTPSVIGNDAANGQPVVLTGAGTNAVLTPGTAPSPAAGSITMNADGTITVAPGTTPGTYTYPYTLCLLAPNAAVCDNATATIVVAATAIVDAVDDPPVTAPGSGGLTPSVIDNDTANGAPAVIGSNVTLLPGTAPTPFAGAITMNPDGTISVAPGTTPGTYTYPYTICLLPATTPATCDTATATVIVTASIDAVDDGPTTIPATGGVAPSVVGNDTVNGGALRLSGPGANATLAPGTAPSPAAGSITMNPDGTLTIAPGTTAGTYTYPYTICIAPPTVPPTCDTAIATVVVTASIDAVDDGPTSVPASGGVVPSVVRNDLSNGQPVVLSGPGTNATLQPGTAPSPAAGSITMNPDGTITVAPGTTPGTYTYPYTICVSPPTAPPTCDTAIATIVVTASIDAVDDGPATIPASGGTLPSVIGNDTSNSRPVVLSGPGTNATLQPGTRPSPTSGAITMNPDGTITIAPGTTPGTYTYPYTICVVPATAPPTCDTAIATVVVTATIVAVDDAPPRVIVTGGSVPSIGGNDTVNGRPLVIAGPGANATLLPVTVPRPVNGSIVVNPDGSIIVAPGTTPGRYTFPYTVCVLPATTPATCSTATVTIVVEGLPPGTLVVAKAADLRGASVGSIVTYTVTVSNTGSVAIVGAEILDTPPAGFAFVTGSASIDDIDGQVGVSGARPLRFTGVDVPANGVVRLRYRLRVGAAVPAGVHTNTAQAFVAGQPASGAAQASVVTGANADPVFEQSRLWGKVFDDRDGDGWQDDGEPGIPGVRVALVEGLVAETDRHGRYHVEGLTLSNLERGQNVIVKLDTATLPAGAKLTTENPLLRRVTAGLPTRFDFGVRLPAQPAATRAVELELGAVVFAPGSASIREAYRPVVERLVASIVEHRGGEIVLAALDAPGELELRRAEAVRDAVLADVPAEVRDAVVVRIDVKEGMAVALDEQLRLGTVLFDTDRTAIRPEFRPLIIAVAQRIATASEPLTVTLTGFADSRAPADYNLDLSRRRAASVADALRAELPPEARAALRVVVDGGEVSP